MRRFGAVFDFNKKPAIGWQSRVLGNLFWNWLEVSSHDAAGAMLPNGHLSLGSLAAQANITRSFHLLTEPLNTTKLSLSSVLNSRGAKRFWAAAVLLPLCFEGLLAPYR